MKNAIVLVGGALATLVLPMSVPVVAAGAAASVLGIASPALGQASSSAPAPPAVQAPPPAGGRALQGLAAVAFAEAQIGTPYEWGGEGVGVGFDCSGLTQAAWRAAGVRIPRVAQAQFDAGPQIPAGVALEPGDLVFFGEGPHDVTHVGIVVDAAGRMIDAPHTGARVRIDGFPVVPGSPWGAEIVIGATRP